MDDHAFGAFASEDIHKYYPDSDLVICGDDDVKNPNNPGRTKAKKAAGAVKGKVALPIFMDPDSGTDFNDLEKAEGLNVVKDQLETVLTQRSVIPVLQNVFPVPSLDGLDARDGTYNTRPLSELGNAMRLLDAHIGNIQYAHDVKAWLIWQDGAWEWCLDGSRVYRLSSFLPEQIYLEGNFHLIDAELYATWARTSQKERIIKASVALFSNFDQIRIRMGLVDADIFKVGLDNAKQVIDLHAGMVRPALREDLITKSLRVSHLGESNQAVRWKEFLAQVFSDDVQVIDWLQRFCGYLLTGSTSEQFFLFCFGFGANGKSVMAETIRFILGDYARAIATETLTQSKRNDPHQQKRTAQEASDCLKLASNSIGLWNPLAECSLTGL